MTKNQDTDNRLPNAAVYGPHQLSEDAQMAEYGIRSEPAYIYLYGDYRYTSFRDALSQAKRDEKTAKS